MNLITNLQIMEQESRGLMSPILFSRPMPTIVSYLLQLDAENNVSNLEFFSFFVWMCVLFGETGLASGNVPLCSL